MAASHKVLRYLTLTYDWVAHLYNNMVSIDLNQEHGKCMAILVLLWIQQQLIFAIFVAIARKKSGSLC